MNKKLIVAALLAGSTIGGIAHAADGTINFTGSITPDACTIDPGSTSPVVLMGNIGAAGFKTVGEGLSPTRFNIVLTSCPATFTNASVKFDGPTNATNSNLLRLTAVAGVATNLGIGIYERDSSTLIPIGSPSANVPLVTGGGPTTMTYIAKYVATALPVGTGPANATSDYTVSYN